MKRTQAVFIFFMLIFLSGNITAQIFPFKQIDKGEASYYAQMLMGRKTANGEILSEYDFTAAHRTLPFGTLLRVTNIKNGKSTVVRINDRGPFNKTRIIDLNRSAAKCLGMMRTGTAIVRLDSLEEICFSQEAEKAYYSGEPVDALGNPATKKDITILAWDGRSLQHCLYMIMDLFLRTGYSDLYILKAGSPGKERFRIFFTGIPNKEAAEKLVDKLMEDGFTRAAIQAE
jgi:rare lipoprotein A